MSMFPVYLTVFNLPDNLQKSCCNCVIVSIAWSSRWRRFPTFAERHRNLGILEILSLFAMAVQLLKMYIVYVHFHDSLRHC